MDKLTSLLMEKKTLLADGAIGTNLFDQGLQPGEAPELLVLNAPETIYKLHQSFAEAGSDIILTNTFGANSFRMALHNAEDDVFEINKRAALIASQVIKDSGRDLVVAGSVGPTGSLFEPMGELTEIIAIAAFSEQIKGLKAGGADIVWIETMSSIEEIIAAAKAAIAIEMPYCVTVSFDTAGKSMMGLAPDKLCDIFNTLEKAPVAIGANCGVGASDLLAAMLMMTEQATEINYIAKANCGIPQIKGDKVIYTGSPDLMKKYVALSMDMGIQIIGGCCGTSFEHVRAMREALDNHQLCERPDNERLRNELGPFSNPIASEGVRQKSRHRRRSN